MLQKNTSLNPKKGVRFKNFWDCIVPSIATYTHKSKDEDGFVDDALTRVSTRGVRDDETDDETDDDDDDGDAFDDFFERERKRKAV